MRIGVHDACEYALRALFFLYRLKSIAAIGLTWWVNDNIRFLANYVRTSLPADENIDIFGLRAQVNW